MYWYMQVKGRIRSVIYSISILDKRVEILYLARKIGALTISRYAAARQCTFSVQREYHVAIRIRGFGRYVRCTCYWPGIYLHLVKSPTAWAAPSMVSMRGVK